jgi:hypothetical protein
VQLQTSCLFSRVKSLCNLCVCHCIFSIFIKNPFEIIWCTRLKYTLYTYIIFYLKNLTNTRHLLDHKNRSLRLKACKYCFINKGLGWRNLDGLILGCVDPEEAKKLMDEFHKSLCGGIHAVSTTSHNTLSGGYYLRSIFSDVHQFIRSFQTCHFFKGK